jgi:hypothetical protein
MIAPCSKYIAMHEMPQCSADTEVPVDGFPVGKPTTATE